VEASTLTNEAAMTMAVTTSPEPDAIIGMGVPHMLNTAIPPLCWLEITLICVAVKQLILRHAASSAKYVAMGFLALSVNSLDKMIHSELC